MIVIDTSVFVDYLVKFDERKHQVAISVLDIISEEGIKLFAPFLFDVEFAGILRRKYGESKVKKMLEIVEQKVNIVEEEIAHETALNIALKTHCRAIDSYFIAIASLTSSILITNDKVMSENAKKFELEAYYLVGEFDDAVKAITEKKNS